MGSRIVSLRYIQFHQMIDFMAQLYQCPSEYLIEIPIKAKLVSLVEFLPHLADHTDSKSIGKFQNYIFFIFLHKYKFLYFSNLWIQNFQRYEYGGQSVSN